MKAILLLFLVMAYISSLCVVNLRSFDPDEWSEYYNKLHAPQDFHEEIIATELDEVEVKHHHPINLNELIEEKILDENMEPISPIPVDMLVDWQLWIRRANALRYVVYVHDNKYDKEMKEIYVTLNENDFDYDMDVDEKNRSAKLKINAFREG